VTRDEAITAAVDAAMRFHDAETDQNKASERAEFIAADAVARRLTAEERS
jgi:hypothetical protein